MRELKTIRVPEVSTDGRKITSEKSEVIIKTFDNHLEVSNDCLVEKEFKTYDESGMLLSSKIKKGNHKGTKLHRRKDIVNIGWYFVDEVDNEPLEIPYFQTAIESLYYSEYINFYSEKKCIEFYEKMKDWYLMPV